MTLVEMVSDLIRQKIPVDEVIEAMIKCALIHYGNIRHVETYLGISRPTIYKRMKEFGITPQIIREEKRRQLQLKHRM